MALNDKTKTEQAALAKSQKAPLNRNKPESSGKGRTALPDSELWLYRSYLLMIERHTRKVKDSAPIATFKGTARRIENGKVSRKSVVMVDGGEMEDVLRRVKEDLDSFFPEPVVATDSPPLDTGRSISIPKDEGDTKSGGGGVPPEQTAAPTVTAEVGEKAPSSVIETSGLKELFGKHLEILKSNDDLVKRIDNLSRIIGAMEEAIDDSKKSQQKIFQTVDEISGIVTARNPIDVDQAEQYFGQLKSILERDTTKESFDDMKMDINRIFTRLDEKIDLKDAKQVLDLRHEVERFVVSNVIHTMSKQIMPAVDLLKEQVRGKERALIDLVEDLDGRCKQAGLIPMHKLFG